MPNSCGFKLLVTISINPNPVKIVTMPTMKKNNPEYVTRMLDMSQIPSHLKLSEYS